jgi:hypothetical protein
MMTARDLLDGDALLPGDVVVDKTTHRPMQVTGYEQRNAEQVPEVWESNVNQHGLSLDPEASVIELIDLPTGNHYYVPEEIERFPTDRLMRIITEPATDERRVQEKVVRSVMAHLLSDLRTHDDGIVAASALLDVCQTHWGDEYVSEVAEFAELVADIGH